MSTAMPLTSLGDALDLSAEHFGWFTSSADLIDDPAALRMQLADEGYLYLPGYLDVGQVREAREVLLGQLDRLGMVDRTHPVSDGVAVRPWQGRGCHHLVQENPPLQELLYAGRMMELYRLLFDKPLRHFDFTWLRVIGPGHGAARRFGLYESRLAAAIDKLDAADGDHARYRRADGHARLASPGPLEETLRRGR